MGKPRVIIQIILDSDYLAVERNWYLRFLGSFGLKTIIDFAHFGLESGIVFEGAKVVYEDL